MDLNQIAVFVRVVDSGSFTQAARFLRQPKSRVSRRISALEKQLGVDLLYRTTRQLSLTEAGRTLYERVRHHVYELEGAAQFLHERSGEVSGVLRLTAAEDLGSALLGPVIAELDTLHPDLSIELMLSNEFVDLVREGVDLAIRIGELEDASLKTRSIGQIVFILVASPDYLKGAPKLDVPGDLSAHPALVFSSDPDEGSWRLRAGSRKEENIKVRAHCRSNNPKVLLDLAIAGKGVALIPEFLCVEALKKGALKRVLSGYEGSRVPIQFVWPAQKETSPKVKAFVALGVKRLAKYFS